MRAFKLIICFILISTFSIAQTYNIKDFGAKKGDKCNNTLAIQKAIDKCNQNGGGTVVFPAGTWLSGTIFLKNNVSVFLSNGAIWQGINDSTAYPLIETRIMSREDRQERRAMVYGYYLENIKIYGEGTFYPGGDYQIFQKKSKYQRPFGIYLVACKNICIDGIFMKNSAFWMQRYFHCDYLKIQNITVFNHCNNNNDGIDIDGCHNVLVDNCIVDASDDALVLKSEGLRNCQDITINNCILGSFATPLKFGTSSIGGYKRININNIVIRPSKSKEMHHEMKAWGGLSGIDIENVDGGILEDILISNVVIDSVQTPLFIKLGNRNSTWEGKSEAVPGIIRNIKINNLIARNCGQISSSITGYPGNYVKDIHLSNIHISVKGNDNLADTTTIVAERSNSYPYNRMFKTNLPSYGFYLRHVNNITFENVTLKVKDKEVRSAFVLDDAKNVSIKGLDADSSVSKQPLIIQLNSQNIVIENKK